jgi:fumarate reductase flavoprotein subunit
MNQPQPTLDVIVIGAGIAGLTAANRAAQLGRRVVVLEKSNEDKYLCNSRYAYGTIHINYSDLEANEESLMVRIEAATEGSARKDLARAVAKDGRRLTQWLRAEGIDVIRLDGYQTNVLAPAWRKGYGLTWKDYGSDICLQRLGANFEKRQGRILRGHRATALKADKGAIVVETSHGSMRAASVVIADGGFQANHDMIRAYGISPAPEKLLARNGGTAIGDGITLAQSLGAAITEADMTNIYGHIHSRDAMQTTRLWPRPYLDETAAAGIVVDGGGRRFADEGFGGIWLTNVIARSADPLAYTIIVDSPIWEGPARNHVQPPNPLIEEAGGTVHRADSLAELAKLAGLPPKGLEETVARYNAAFDAGALQQLTPSRRSDRNKPWPIRTPPYYAIPICVAITNCMGGIVVDGDGRVLDKNDRPIPSLYAAGSTVGGLCGGPHAGYVGGLIKAVIGLRAAETIAAA